MKVVDPRYSLDDDMSCNLEWGIVKMHSWGDNATHIAAYKDRFIHIRNKGEDYRGIGSESTSPSRRGSIRPEWRGGGLSADLLEFVTQHMWAAVTACYQCGEAVSCGSAKLAA